MWATGRAQDDRRDDRPLAWMALGAGEPARRARLIRAGALARMRVVTDPGARRLTDWKASSWSRVSACPPGRGLVTLRPRRCPGARWLAAAGGGGRGEGWVGL